MSFSTDGLQGFRALLSGIKERMMQGRNEYENVVHQMYQTAQPFAKHRAATRENFQEELIILGEMVAHCVVLESFKILDMYAIYQIRANPRILASHHNMDAYIAAFYQKLGSSQSDGEKLYLQKLINEFGLIKSQLLVGA